MADAHKRKFDGVVVWRFDRFARSVSHLLRALETFNALGIAFVSLSEARHVDTYWQDGVHRPRRRCGTGAIPDWPCEGGAEECARQGKRLGRPKKLLSASRIASLRARGCSWRTIARQMGCSGQDGAKGVAKTP